VNRVRLQPRQPDLPLDRFLCREPAGGDAIAVDFLVVGAGPAGLAAAISFAQGARAAGRDDLQVAVLEKAESLGQHNLSGAVVNPRSLRALFPGKTDAEFPFRAPVAGERVYFLTPRRAWRVPTPPPMRNHGNFVASICEVVRWMGKEAEALGVNLFTGFPAASLRVDGERVTGARTQVSGLRRDGSPGPNHTPGTDLTAAVTALAEGTRGPLSMAWTRWRGVPSPNPQVFALGVKEVWETKRSLEAVVHTMGWPLPPTSFGGSFAYPLDASTVALGIVVGLDHEGTDLDPHFLLQRLKTHPFFRRLLEGGTLLEWGAKTIPEGGWWSLPDRLSGDGVLLLGDAAGFVDVPSLKGIHYAVQSGIEAGRAALRAVLAGDPSAAALSGYDRAIRGSFVGEDLRRRRNERLGFRHGPLVGALVAALSTVTGGRAPHGRVRMRPDVAAARRPRTPAPLVPDRALTFSKVDGVFKSGNTTRDDIPSHLVVGEDIPPEVADLYARICPAGVYERRGDRLVVNPPNCVDCKATDVIGPRWTPREGGSGPRYQRM
jgi:electron-transferring-flavoprotein dehydrogenase